MPAGERRTGGHVTQLVRLVAVLAVAAVAIPVLNASDRVAVRVDGQVRNVRSYGTTVKDVLTAADVEVGVDDVVTPPLTQPVSDGLQVDVMRAVPVTLSVRGHLRQLPVAGDTVDDVLVAAGLGEVRGLTVEPSPDTPLAGVRRVDVTEPVTVRVKADGDTEQVRLEGGGTVARALAMAGVTVGADDTVSVPLDRDLTNAAGPVAVRVTRVDADTVVTKVALPFQEKVVQTSKRHVGDKAVVRDGAEGVRKDRYKVTKVDGEVTDRELLSKQVVTKAIDRVVEIGTAPLPKPEPKPEAKPEPKAEVAAAQVDPDPTPTATSAPSSSAPTDGVWRRLAACESNGDWTIDTGNGYFGGLQFSLGTWRNVGGAGYPDEASIAEQIARAERLLQRNGGVYSRAWPACSAKLGLQ